MSQRKRTRKSTPHTKKAVAKERRSPAEGARGPAWPVSLRYVNYTVGTDEDAADELLDSAYHRELDRICGELGITLHATLQSPEFKAAKTGVEALLRREQPDAEALIALALLARHVLRLFTEEAMSRQPAARMLVAIAEYAVSALRLPEAELLRPLAASRTDWPCLVSMTDLAAYSGRHALSPRRWLQEIALGSQAECRPRDTGDPSCYAAAMYRTLDDNRALVRGWTEQAAGDTGIKAALGKLPEWVRNCGDLPPLRAGPSCEQWFSLGWQAILDATKGQPEKNRSLRPLGEHRQEHYVPMGRYQAVPERTRESNIRDGIKKALKRAFTTLAKGASAD